MVRSLAVAIACLFVAPATASALPAAHPPGKSPAGITLSWPLKKDVTVVDRGRHVSVKVRSPRRRVTVSLYRAGGSGWFQAGNAAQLRLSATTIAPGAALLYTIVNTS